MADRASRPIRVTPSRQQRRRPSKSGLPFPWPSLPVADRARASRQQWRPEQGAKGGDLEKRGKSVFQYFFNRLEKGMSILRPPFGLPCVSDGNHWLATFLHFQYLILFEHMRETGRARKRDTLNKLRCISSISFCLYKRDKLGENEREEHLRS